MILSKNQLSGYHILSSFLRVETSHTNEPPQLQKESTLSRDIGNGIPP